MLLKCIIIFVKNVHNAIFCVACVTTIWICWSFRSTKRNRRGKKRRHGFSSFFPFPAVHSIPPPPPFAPPTKFGARCRCYKYSILWHFHSYERVYEFRFQVFGPVYKPTPSIFSRIYVRKSVLVICLASVIISLWMKNPFGPGFLISLIYNIYLVLTRSWRQYGFVNFVYYLRREQVS